MADPSHLHDHDENDHLHDVPASIPPQNNHSPHHLHEFDFYPTDLHLFVHRCIDRIPPPISSPHRDNQVDFVNDTFHQRVEQSQSQPSDRSIRVIDDIIIPNEIEANCEPRLGFENSDNPNFDDDNNNSGFVITDSADSSQSGGENEIIEMVDEEASSQLWWDIFQLEDEITNPNSNSNANANEDFEWEEVDEDDAPVSPVLLAAFEDPSEEPVEWQVLTNVNSFDPSPDSEDQYEDYNYTEYEMFLGQFGDSDASLSGRPPASKTVVVNLSSVVVSQEDVVENNIVCAVCKDEVVVGELVTRLPCGHGYHGGCILPWLAVRNTCPVCRHELPTDDVDYERRKVERGGNV